MTFIFYDRKSAKIVGLVPLAFRVADSQPFFSGLFQPQLVQAAESRNSKNNLSALGTAVKKRQLRKMASVRDGMVTAHVPWSVPCSCMHANASHKLTKIVFAFGENIFDSLWRLARFA